MRILGIPANADGSGYYRIYQPLARLAADGGHEVTLPPRGTHILPYQFWLDDLDVIVGQRLGGSVGYHLWRSWAESWRGKLVYEIDDNVFAPDTPLDGVTGNIGEGVQACAAMADLVVVSTPTLAEVMRRYNPNVVVLPNYIHADLLTIERHRRDKVTVGWAGGTSHTADMTSAAGQLRRLLDRNPHVDMHFVGADFSPLVGRGRHTPWSPDVWDYYRSIDFDIGIAPLITSVFNDSKSYIKALEYAALGIPVVASDEPPYRDFVIDGVTGYLVRREHEWGRRLYELANDEQMRAEMGAKAREHAAHFTIQEHWTDWEKALGS